MDDSAASRKADSCFLSLSLERMVLESPALHADDAVSMDWGFLALANMAAILRKNGYDVKEPLVGSGETAEEMKAEEASKTGWSDDGETSTAACRHPPEPFARFHILTTIMDENRGEDGRVNAAILEEKLLSQDEHAYKKENVEQLRAYLMRAREIGIPIKFDGDRNALTQVWFKGHKDLETALARYSFHYAGRSPVTANSRSMSDYNWRAPRPPHDSDQQQHFHAQCRPHSPPYQQHNQQRTPHHSPHYTPGHRNNDMPNRYRIPSERVFDTDFLLDIVQACGADYQQGAEADRVEQRLLDVVKGLYEIKPGVKQFNHYLMNMRAAGAPIWFTRDEEGRPQEIFIKNLATTPVHHCVFQPVQPNALPPAPSPLPPSQERFESLIEAYQFHLQPDGDVADSRLVQSRLEAKDPTIYTREQCSTFKHLLKQARLSGMHINWEQSDTGVTTICMRLGSRG